jgi:hypothetical protein
MVDEKRAYQRYALWFPVTVDSTSGKIYAVCRDASAAGILISGSTGLAVGDRVHLHFRIGPDDPEERKVEGRIVRVEHPDEDPRAMWPHRMAVEFAEPVPALQSLFKRASSRPPPP